MARKNTHSPEKLTETQQKRNTALEMRLAGKSQAQIAVDMGVHKSTVSIWIKDAIADITRENAEEYLEMELQRLDAMFAAIWNQIVNPKSADERAGQTWKIDRALAIMEQRAKLTGTYKSAELRAIADAKGGVSVETASMIGRFFDALETVAANAEDSEPDDSE